MPAKMKIKSRRHAPWTAAELKHLGKTPDSVLARRFSRTIEEVVAERERRRLALPTPARRWTAREIKLLGSRPDMEVARRLRRDRNDVRRQRIELHLPPYRPRPKFKAWTSSRCGRLAGGPR